MAVILFGTTTKHKIIGVRGDKVECFHCHRKYAPSLILEAEYFHIDYIPLHHYLDRDVYNTVCPVCGFKDFIATYKAREISSLTVSKEIQDLSYLAVQKDKNKYDFVVMDNLTKEQTLIAPNVKMSEIKSSVRIRGGKPKEIIKVV